MKVLVTGAAGYIGSHAVRSLRQRGHAPFALDNLSRGHRQAVPADIPFVEADVRNTETLASLLRTERFDCVMHFAAFAYVGESVEAPLKYFDNNVGGTLSLLKALAGSEVRRLVFSSTCATYGDRAEVPIVEGAVQQPINPYGASKLFCERMILDLQRSLPDLGVALLRYFNVAGCAEDGTLGEDHDPETHLVPVMLRTALGLHPKLLVFGDDYPTPDGTCIRDYLHVEDLVEAHGGVMEALERGDRRVYNLGVGRGYSVREMLTAASDVVGFGIPFEVAARRPGDPAVLYADASKIEREVGWSARHTDLREVIESAWRWFRRHPQGYTPRA
ncbi:MAG: UDP-glucose 4-epimerase GalE [Deltaproteobacteria bacterium]